MDAPSKPKDVRPDLNTMIEMNAILIQRK